MEEFALKLIWDFGILGFWGRHFCVIFLADHLRLMFCFNVSLDVVCVCCKTCCKCFEMYHCLGLWILFLIFLALLQARDFWNVIRGTIWKVSNSLSFHYVCVCVCVCVCACVCVCVVQPFGHLIVYISYVGGEMVVLSKSPTTNIQQQFKFVASNQHIYAY
jgi:hypothetical protein